MKIINFIAALSISTSALADEAAMIRQYAADIHAGQRKVAQNLVSQHIRKFMLNDEEIAKQISDRGLDVSEDHLINSGDALANVMASDKSWGEKAVLLGSVLGEARQYGHRWGENRLLTKRAFEKFLSNIQGSEKLCGDNGFYQGLAKLESMEKAPSMKVLSTKIDHEVGVKVIVDDNGNTSYERPDAPAPEDKAKDARRAIESMVLAYSSSTVAGFFVAAGAILIVESVAASIENRAHIRRVKNLVKANNALFQASKFEENVHKYYSEICANYEKAYGEVRQVIVQEKGAARDRRLLAMAAENKEDSLEDVSSRPEKMAKYIKYKVAMNAYVVLSDNGEAWSKMNAEIQEKIDNLENGITLFVARDYDRNYSPDLSTLEGALRKTDALRAMKQAFYNELSKYNTASDTSTKAQCILGMENALESYLRSFPAPSAEEIALLTELRDIVSELRK